MKLFLDVDNTILEHSGFYSIETESRVHSTIGKYPIDNAKAIQTMYESSICRNPDIVRSLLQLDNVYILTKYPTIEYEIHKQKRVAEILGLSRKQLLNLTDRYGNKKYIYLKYDESKVSVVKDVFNLENLSNCYLVDDFSYNLIEWENNNGISIKYYNEYNSYTHPTSGLSISNFRIFDFFLNNYHLEDLMIMSSNKYKLNMFTKALEKYVSIHKIDLLEEVYNDLKDKLGHVNIKTNNKYNINNFLIEYYHFQENINESYWFNNLESKINRNYGFNIIQSCFDIDLNKLHLFHNTNNLTLKITNGTKKESSNIYDIYLTLDESSFVDDIDKAFAVIIDNLLSIIIKERF